MNSKIDKIKTKVMLVNFGILKGRFDVLVGNGDFAHPLSKIFRSTVAEQKMSTLRFEKHNKDHRFDS
jgi:hypothetical protein